MSLVARGWVTPDERGIHCRPIRDRWVERAIAFSDASGVLPGQTEVGGMLHRRVVRLGAVTRNWSRCPSVDGEGYR